MRLDKRFATLTRLHASKVRFSITWEGPERGQYRCSDKGWITEILFVQWHENLFLVETANIPRPLLLIMGNLSAHISVKVIELAQKHQVILMCLPPNTTRALQPLDVTTFGLVF
ncbi:unnamed protein product [Rotaria magnacalcarata]|uniref:DDE-1 domain-containing protein n=1 Tax=Rotaria magnacalcarata TaxID=392030 RepID=A0A816TEK2_9BILA|nr:unnamed protein product [Rotaria magnacalcarata]CAF2095388.1 unnamed protein product [Rotaria magnacalcarata]CAF3809613.1 unnamed protein product [Rotaria magnacalcarata]CAF4005471.1 unnamed protein product [Rotaria magnacalcarata]